MIHDLPGNRALGVFGVRMGRRAPIWRERFLSLLGGFPPGADLAAPALEVAEVSMLATSRSTPNAGRF